MKNEYGTIVRSLAGHDKDEYFILVEADEKHLYMVDGKSRTLDKSKKKNRKHIQFIGENIFDKCNESGSNIKVTNELIKKNIKEYKNKIKG